MATTKSFEFPQPLTEKYRPRTIDGFAGLSKVKAVLNAFIKRPRSCGFLFLGPSGRGKTTMALALCESLGADLHLVPSQECNVDNISNVMHLCHYAAFNFTTGKACPLHFILVDEAHKMTNGAQTALLSRLDATAFPPDTVMVFTATTAIPLEPPFLSRLMVLNFDDEGLSDDLPKYLQRIAKLEGLKYKLDFAHIALAGGYNVRDSMMKLELEIMGAGYLRDAKSLPVVPGVNDGEWKCAVVGCTNTRHGRGFCKKHYRDDWHDRRRAPLKTKGFQARKP